MEPYQLFSNLLVSTVEERNSFAKNKKVVEDEYTIIISVILSYLPPDATLLVDLNENTTINCIHKYICFEKPKQDYHLRNDYIWLGTTKKMYICKPQQTKTNKKTNLINNIFSKNKNNENKATEEYEVELIKNPNKARDMWTEPNLDKIINIRALCITPSYHITIIADDGYKYENMWVYNDGHFHWTGNKRPGTVGGRSSMYSTAMYDKYHYITSELLTVLRQIWVDSTSNLWHAGQPVCFILYAPLQSIEKREGNVFNEIIRIDGKDNNREHHRSIGKDLKELHDLFNENEHILFVYGERSWTLYVPKSIYLKCAKQKQQINLNNKGAAENCEEINVDPIRNLYRITNDYVIYWNSDHKFKKWNVKINAFIPQLLWNDYYECVLNDFLYQRLLVSKDCQLFELKPDQK